LPRPLVNSFHGIHTAIGGELLKLEAHARSVDPNSPESVGGFVGHFGMLSMIQEGHSHEEENGVWPRIETRIPGLPATFLFDHEGERKYMADIQTALGELQGSGGDKADASARLYRNTVALSAHLIHHMAKEEALLYGPFADKLSEEEEWQIISAVYAGLLSQPNADELMKQALPWLVSYQTPEEIATESDTMLRAIDGRKVGFVLGIIVNGLPLEKWAELQKLRPQLAEYRTA
jgi:hypothetical protein